MSLDDEIKAVIENPREALAVEYKQWLDLTNISHAAKIIKTVLALRNYDGGKLVIGFDDKTLKPDKAGAPTDVKATFHSDVIQGLISKYASERFEVDVQFPEIDGTPYPVIIVPSEIKAPVAVKKELKDGDKILLKQNAIYRRSLSSNGIASSTEISYQDWAEFCQVMFDNREADIGRFLRRHLGGFTKENIQKILENFDVKIEPLITDEKKIFDFITESEERFKLAVKERKLDLPQHGTIEAAFFILGEVPQHRATSSFLRLLDAENPRHSGWPMWLNSEGFSNLEDRPYVTEEGLWESLIVSLRTGWSDRVDFMRIDPKGKFYLRRALQDDIGGSDKAPLPMTELDFGLTIYRVTEVISTAIAFAKAMGCDAEKTSLLLAFKWTKLKGRKLSSWADSWRFMMRSTKAHADTVSIAVAVPLDAPLSALEGYVEQTVDPLFEIFGGKKVSQEAISQIVDKVIKGKY